MAQSARVAALPRLLTLDDAAEYLGVTNRTIRNYIAAGVLPAFRLGTRGVRVRETDVEAMLRPIPTIGGAA